MRNTFHIAPLFQSGFDLQQLLIFPFLGIVMLFAWVTMKRTPKFQKGQTINSLGVAAVTAVSLLLYILYGTGMNLIKGVLLADLCLYASVSDIQTRKVTDAVPVMLFLLGLVNVSQAVLLCRTITALAFFGVFLLLAVVFKNKIGGADIKFISASMMLTGFTKGFVGLIAGLLLIAKKAMPAFRSVFRKYDKLNESIEENVRAMRVVKGFSREAYEKQKFGAAADNICRDFTRAERIVALNNPLMQLCMYFNMLFILTVGARIRCGALGWGTLDDFCVTAVA